MYSYKKMNNMYLYEHHYEHLYEHLYEDLYEHLYEYVYEHLLRTRTWPAGSARLRGAGS